MRIVMRTALVAAVAMMAGAGTAHADWRDEVSRLTLVMGIPETDTERRDQTRAYGEYLADVLGIDVVVRLTPEHAASIEAMRAGQVDIARLGPAGYAIGYEEMGAEGIVPLVMELGEDGSFGYSTIIIVRSDSDIQSFEDLQGRSLTFTNASSMSGGVAPRYFLAKELGVPDPGAYFSRTGFAGNHDNAVMAVVNGVYDAAFTWEASEEDSVPARMARQGMIERDAVRIVYKSPPMPRGVLAARGALPADLLDELREALLAFEETDPERWQAATSGLSAGLREATHEHYADAVAIRAFQRELLTGRAN